MFWFPSAYKSYVYIIKCAIALCLKKQCAYLNLKNNAVGKVVLENLLNTGLPQTFNV